MSIMKKNLQVDENGRKYMIFRIDAYFSKCFLAIEIDEKGHTNRDIIFEEKRQKALGKKLGCKFTRINICNAKNGYDLDYEVVNVQAFIDEFKNERKNRKRNERKIRKRTKRQK